MPALNHRMFHALLRGIRLGYHCTTPPDERFDHQPHGRHGRHSVAIELGSASWNAMQIEVACRVVATSADDLITRIHVVLPLLAASDDSLPILSDAQRRAAAHGVQLQVRRDRGLLTLTFERMGEQE